MNDDRRIFLFQDLPSMGQKNSFRLIDRSTLLGRQLSIFPSHQQTYVESYRFGNDFLITETDYILLPKKLATLRAKIFNHP